MLHQEWGRTSEQGVHGLRNVCVDAPAVAVDDLHGHVEGRGRHALDDRLLAAPPLGLLITQRHPAHLFDIKVHCNMDKCNGLTEAKPQLVKTHTCYGPWSWSNHKKSGKPAISDRRARLGKSCKLACWALACARG